MSFSRLKSASLSLLFGFTSALGMSVPKANASWDSDVPQNYVTHLNLVRGSNQAINIHQPRNGQWINSWDLTKGDPDQELKIVRIGGNKVYIFKNGTNMLLSVKDNPYDGSELEAWNYVQGSWAQIWEMVPATVGGAYTIRLAAKPHLGITIPGGRKDRRITLATIGHGNTTQEFGLSYHFQGQATVNPGSWVQPMQTTTQPTTPKKQNVATLPTTKQKKPIYYPVNRLTSANNKIACVGPAMIPCAKVLLFVVETAIVWAIGVELDKLYNQSTKKEDIVKIAFRLKDEYNISWDTAAKQCDSIEKVNGGDYFLTWNKGLKTCMKFQPVPDAYE